MIYVFPALLDACRQVIGSEFRLSSDHARALQPQTNAGDWHVDVQRGSKDFPLVGFIFMIDAFTQDDSATRLVPGTHRWRKTPQDSMQDCRADVEGQQLAYGPAGSLLIFNGSVWDGHGANRTNRPRRSLQGAFIPSGGQAATDFTSRMTPETRRRLGPAAQSVLGLSDQAATETRRARSLSPGQSIVARCPPCLRGACVIGTIRVDGPMATARACGTGDHRRGSGRYGCVHHASARTSGRATPRRSLRSRLEV
ncbi:MAG: hypothetical protein FJW22_00570 [Acidimicrobiia bacterium]|nr:hypothetical protein [Acidimicrobiia bacterium]